MPIDPGDERTKSDCPTYGGHHGDEPGLDRGLANAPNPKIQVLAYGPEGFEEFEALDLGQISPVLKRMAVTWVNVDGHTNASTISRLGEVFNIHHLALEDVMNVRQRAKVEQYGTNEFIVARMVMLGERLETEQFSIYLGENFVVTFQEEDRPSDNFDEVRDRIRKDRGRIRTTGPDYLVYALLDAVVDAYFPVLEAYGERLEDLEDEILECAVRSTLHRIHAIKRDLLVLRRAIWPMREAINLLYRDPQPIIKDETRIYLRDCYDHCIRIIDLLETDRELCSDLMDVYLSSVSNKLNEVMKMLTIITSIFIPPTFIAGIYGMNFNTRASSLNMPELNWYYGYPFALMLMVVFAGGLLWFLWWGGWIGARDLMRKSSEPD